MKTKRSVGLNVWVWVFVVVSALAFFIYRSNSSLDSEVMTKAPTRVITQRESPRDAAVKLEPKRKQPFPRPKKNKDLLPILPEDLERALNDPAPELSEEFEAQLQARPRELPEDLNQQLLSPWPELPEDLRNQLEAPPQELPEDIRRALTKSRRVGPFDEVTTPMDPGY